MRYLVTENPDTPGAVSIEMDEQAYRVLLLDLADHPAALGNGDAILIRRADYLDTTERTAVESGRTKKHLTLMPGGKQ